MDLLWLLVTIGAVAAGAVVACLRLQRAAREVAAHASELKAALDDFQPGPAPRFYYLRAGALPRGPVELTTLRAMVIDGRLDADALAAVAGTDRWRQVGDLLADGVRAGSTSGCIQAASRRTTEP